MDHRSNPVLFNLVITQELGFPPDLIFSNTWAQLPVALR